VVVDFKIAQVTTALDPAPRAAEESSPFTRWVWHGEKPVWSPSPTASASQKPFPYYADKLFL
jgi:hypothetical protein